MDILIHLFTEIEKLTLKTATHLCLSQKADYATNT